MNCADCGLEAVVLLVVTTTIAKQSRTFKVCGRCWIKRGRE